MIVDICRSTKIGSGSVRVEMHDIPRPGDVIRIGGNPRPVRVEGVIHHARRADSPQVLPPPMIIVTDTGPSS